MLNNQTNEPRKNGSSLVAHRLLARISHTQSTAAADLAASTAFRDPLFAGHAPCIHSHLHPLATIRCEKSRLVDSRVEKVVNKISRPLVYLVTNAFHTGAFFKGLNDFRHVGGADI